MEDALQPLLRALHFCLLLGLFGATAFPLIGLRGVVNAPAPTWMTGGAVLAPVASTALMLVGIAAMMGQPVQQLDWPTIWAITASTDIGWSFVLRLGLLVAATIALLRHSPIAAILYGAALITLPWTGHAAVGTGALGMLHQLNDAIHLLAAGLWSGAIGWFAMLTFRNDHTDQSALSLLGAMHRFAPLGIALVGMVTATGVINSLLIAGPALSLDLVETPYGQVLAIKLGLVGLMLLCAARNSSLAKRSFRAEVHEARDHRTTLAAARMSLAAELVLALGVIVAVAVLGLLSPVPG